MKTKNSSKSKQQHGPEPQSQGCWLGVFATKTNLFCEVNASGQKPNLASLAKEEPSGGVWLGAFCRQKTKQGSSGDNGSGGSIKKNGQKKSNMVCDGGGWLRSEKQRTSFLLVIQDEIVKSPTKNEVKAIENGGGVGDDTNNTTTRLKKSNSGGNRKALKAIGNGNDTVASYSTSRAIVVKPMSYSNIRKLSSKPSSKTTTTTKSSSNTKTNNDIKKSSEELVEVVAVCCRLMTGLNPGIE